MSLSTNQSIVRGTFTSDGTSEQIVVPWLPSFFKVRNITQFGSTSASTPVMIAERTSEMPEASALTYTKTSGSATLDLPTMNLTDGIFFVDTSSQELGSEITGTAITNADPAVATATSHGLIVGDRIRIYNSTGMLQIAGMEFTVTDVPTSDTFTLGTLDASGFSSAATAFTVRTIPDPLYFPPFFWITNISQASNAVVQLSTASSTVNNFGVDQEIRLIVPSEFGMTQADNQRATIVSRNNTNGTITLDLDTSSFTAFAFPSSATAAAGVSFPQVIPFGTVSTDIQNPVTNQANFQVRLGTNAIGDNNDVMEWVASLSLTI